MALNHKGSMYQPFSVQKKKQTFIALITAAVITITGAVGGVFASRKVEEKKNETKTSEFSNIDESLYEGLILTDDFDINDKDAVKKRATEIYNISDKSISIEEIMNLIYYFNSSYDKLLFKGNATNEEKFEAIQNYALEVYNLLKQNLADDTQGLYAVISGEDKLELKENDFEIYSYMFVAQGKGVTNSDKELLIKLAKVTNEQLNDIKENNEKDFESNANNFYMSLKEIKENKKVSDGVRVLGIYDAKSKSSVFELTGTQKKYVNENSQNNYLNAIGFEATKKVGAYKDVQAGGDYGKDLTPTTEGYVAKDKEKAEAIVNNSGNKKEENTTKIIDKGGKKVTTEQQVITKPSTTKVEKHTFVVVPEVPTGTITEIVTGGQVISEEYVDSDVLDAEKYVDQENETYVVDQGGVSISLN